jgi:non-homologous end joining protein Ku
MVKGYEFAKDQYVAFSQGDQDVKSARIRQIPEFVPVESIDPVFRQTYYRARQGRQPYTLLTEALRSRSAAVGRWMAKGKAYIVILRPRRRPHDAAPLRDRGWPARRST